MLYNNIAIATTTSSILVWLILEWLFSKASLSKQRLTEAQERFLKEKNKALLAENEVTLSRQLVAEEQHKLLEAEKRVLKAENDSIRFQSFWEGFRESLDKDFASVFANRLEELRGFFRRLNNDIDNVAHDLRKAPLLGIETDVKGRIIKTLEEEFTFLSDTEKEKIIKSVINFLTSTDTTIKSIDWVLKDLREVANLDSNKIEVQSVIREFLNNRPPFANSNSITVEFQDRTTKPVYILCNEWHLKSIIKNVLYNCTAALTDYITEKYIEEGDSDFEGKILITCYNNTENVYISIADNGSGYPEDIINKLYQTSEKVKGK